MTYCGISLYSDIANNMPVESAHNLADYYNTLGIRTGSIKVADLIKVIRTLENEKEETFEKEFKVRLIIHIKTESKIFALTFATFKNVHVFCVLLVNKSLPKNHSHTQLIRVIS